jgi:flagellin
MSRINTNIDALTAQRNLMVTGMAFSKVVERLASGLRINRAADDAAGLSISERLRSQVRGLQRAVANAQDGISLIQTAEGAMQEMHGIVQRIRELAIQAANDTLTTDDRIAIQLEVAQLTTEIQRIATTTEFNTQSLLSGQFTGKQVFVGANTNQFIQVSIDPVTVGQLLLTLVNLNTLATLADEQITFADFAITTLSNRRATLGAIQNRLEVTVRNLSNVAENITAAESRIRDADIAAATVEFVRLQILQQSGTAVLAQANQNPQTVLQLLR